MLIVGKGLYIVYLSETDPPADSNHTFTHQLIHIHMAATTPNIAMCIFVIDVCILCYPRGIKYKRQRQKYTLLPIHTHIFVAEVNFIGKNTHRYRYTRTHTSHLQVYHMTILQHWCQTFRHNTHVSSSQRQALCSLFFCKIHSSTSAHYT